LGELEVPKLTLNHFISLGNDGLSATVKTIGEPSDPTQEGGLLPQKARLESFIVSSFRSVWALELLRHLAENPGKFFTSEELIAALRASDAVVSQSVDNLTAAGLAVVDGEGRAGYHEASAEQGALVKWAIDLYARSPDKVRRLIVAQSAPGVTAFANAFKLRRD
jgi:hypothetical protein